MKGELCSVSLLYHWGKAKQIHSFRFQCHPSTKNIVVDFHTKLPQTSGLKQQIYCSTESRCQQGHAVGESFLASWSFWWLVNDLWCFLTCNWRTWISAFTVTGTLPCVCLCLHTDAFLVGHQSCCFRAYTTPGGPHLKLAVHLRHPISKWSQIMKYWVG